MISKIKAFFTTNKEGISGITMIVVILLVIINLVLSYKLFTQMKPDVEYRELTQPVDTTQVINNYLIIESNKEDEYLENRKHEEVNNVDTIADTALSSYIRKFIRSEKLRQDSQ